jgi:hypothetical protein
VFCVLVTLPQKQLRVTTSLHVPRTPTHSFLSNLLTQAATIEELGKCHKVAHGLNVSQKCDVLARCRPDARAKQMECDGSLRRRGTPRHTIVS